MRETTTGTSVQTCRTQDLASLGPMWESLTSCPFTQDKGHRWQASLSPTQALVTHVSLSLADHNPHTSCVLFVLAQKLGSTWHVAPPLPPHDCLRLWGDQ